MGQSFSRNRLVHTPQPNKKTNFTKSLTFHISKASTKKFRGEEDPMGVVFARNTSRSMGLGVVAWFGTIAERLERLLHGG
eukprot:1392297-Amorphochlora_amoeboformis.AAC.2